MSITYVLIYEFLLVSGSSVFRFYYEFYSWSTHLMILCARKQYSTSTTTTDYKKYQMMLRNVSIVIHPDIVLGCTRPIGELPCSTSKLLIQQNYGELVDAYTSALNYIPIGYELASLSRQTMTPTPDSISMCSFNTLELVRYQLIPACIEHDINSYTVWSRSVW